MKTRDARFRGHGNFVQGDGHSRVKGWRVSCSRCEALKVVSMPNVVLPPDAVLKRLVQAGWHIGKRPADDICGECQRKPKEPKSNGAIIPVSSELVTSALQKEVAALRLRVAEALKREQAASLRVAEDEVVFRRLHEMWCRGQRAGLVLEIERHMPHWPWPKDLQYPKANGAAPTTIAAKSDDFDRWLTDLDKSHRVRPRP
jgi:hypothetical protein